MEHRDQPERIEIELTSHEPPPTRPVRVRAAEKAGDTRSDADADPNVDADTRNDADADADVVVAASTPIVRGPLTRAQGPLLVAGTVIGLIGLLLGFVLGRSGASDDLAGGAPASTVAPSTTVDESLTALDAPNRFDEGTASVTTERRRRATTTTQAPGPVRGEVDIAPVIAGADFELVAIRNRGEIVIVDVASGETTELTSGISQFPIPEQIHAGDGWVLVPDNSGGGLSTLIRDDGTTERVDTGPGWSMMMEEGSDVFWNVGEFGPSASTAAEFRYDGTATGRELDLPDWPVAVDPNGGLAIASSGGVYSFDGTRSERVTTGRILALGSQRVLAHECDASFECSFVVIDRAGGDRRTVAISGLDTGQRLDLNLWYGASGVMNAGEDAALVWAWDPATQGPPDGGHLDLETGVFTELSSPVNEPARMVWSPDGQFALWLDAGTLNVFDPQSGRSVPFAGDFGTVQVFTVRTTS